MPTASCSLKTVKYSIQIYRGDMTRSALLDKICDAVTVLMRGGEDSESLSF